MAYVAPNWVNGQAPALDAETLNAICQALAKLPMENGGTFATSGAAGLYNLINAAATLTSSTLASGDYVGIKDVSAGTGKQVTLSNLASWIGSNGTGAKIATGSYTGTGTYGSANPNSITFPFTPKLVIIFGSKNPNLSGFVNQVVSCFDTNNAGGGTNNRVVLWSEIPTSYSSTQNGPFIGDFDYQKDTYRNVSRAKKSGNTLSWYCGAESTWNNVSTYGPYSQLNINNVKYYWIAFG